MDEQVEIAVAVAHGVRIMSASGKGALFYIDLFEFCNKHLQSLHASDLATYVYEAGRHGLRCRHFMDIGASHAARRVNEMNLTDVMRAWQGLLRFSRDRREYYIAAQSRIRVEVADLNVTQLLLALRASRDLKHSDAFVDLHAV